MNTATHVFQGNLEIPANETQMMVSFGIDQRMPMITIYGPDKKELVQFWRDGTCRIHDEAYLDDAAKTFVNAVHSVMKQQAIHPGWVVRKESVSEFLQMDESGVGIVQTVDEATHFARERDAMAACRRPGYEVVLASEAMIF